jgi:hypothetical protein
MKLSQDVSEIEDPKTVEFEQDVSEIEDPKDVEFCHLVRSKIQKPLN